VNKAVYVALALNPDEEKGVIGLWIEQNEGQVLAQSGQRAQGPQDQTIPSSPRSTDSSDQQQPGVRVMKRTARRSCPPSRRSAGLNGDKAFLRLERPRSSAGRCARSSPAPSARAATRLWALTLRCLQANRLPCHQCLILDARKLDPTFTETSYTKLLTFPERASSILELRDKPSKPARTIPNFFSALNRSGKKIRGHSIK
jgi:hypothetical protein